MLSGFLMVWNLLASSSVPSFLQSECISSCVGYWLSGSLSLGELLSLQMRLNSLPSRTNIAPSARYFLLVTPWVQQVEHRSFTKFGAPRPYPEASPIGGQLPDSCDLISMKVGCFAKGRLTKLTALRLSSSVISLKIRVRQNTSTIFSPVGYF